MTEFNRKNIISLSELSADEIVHILDTAISMKQITTRDLKKVPTLQGVTVVNLFFEPSTRTRSSFEIAEKRLSADVLNFTSSQSSVVKGESLIDTAKNLESMGASIIVIRHPMSGAPWVLARESTASIINAGDGSHEHPSQALLDLFTIRQIKGKFENLNVLIVGDILNSRVARSNIFGLLKLGANVRLVGPGSLIPSYFMEMGLGIYYRLEDALVDTDVIIMLRIQKERKSLEYFPSIREYSRFFGLTKEKLKMAKDDVMIMHPGPINRGVEMTSEVADDERSVILDQVTNGIAIRMAMIYLVASWRSKN
ncbi:MAG: aspartate carbamoyltransferase catalytic subunit [Thermodesulfobacteriota bacterium]